jgi:hypothetical protein
MDRSALTQMVPRSVLTQMVLNGGMMKEKVGGERGKHGVSSKCGNKDLVTSNGYTLQETGQHYALLLVYIQ